MLKLLDNIPEPVGWFIAVAAPLTGFFLLMWVLYRNDIRE